MIFVVRDPAAARNKDRCGIRLHANALPCGSRLRWRNDAREQDCENPGQEYSIESAGAADGGDRRAKAADLVQIEKIGTDQGSHGSADVGQWRRVLAGKKKSQDCGG